MKTLRYGMMTFLLTLVLLPTHSFAYQTTKQTARSYSDTTALFTITYKFGFLNRELYIPVLTNRGTTTSARDAVGYTITTKKNNVTTVGATQGIVLSKAAIKDGMYYLPPGKSAEFTLVTVLTIPAGMTPEQYALQVTSLPFVMVEKGQKYNAQLNPSELQFYVTPTANLPKTKNSVGMTLVGTTHYLKTDSR